MVYQIENQQSHIQSQNIFIKEFRSCNAKYMKGVVDSRHMVSRVAAAGALLKGVYARSAVLIHMAGATAILGRWHAEIKTDGIFT